MPGSSIEHKVRNSIILTFPSFSITHQLEKPAFYASRDVLGHKKPVFPAACVIEKDVKVNIMLF